jgi:SAM-dependent methyltransferase
MLESRRIEEELMDDPALDPAVYTQVLHDLARVNRITMAHGPTLAFLERAVGRRTNFRLLDVGFGDGDMLRQIAKWALRKGIKAELVGIDLNDKSVAAALEATPDLLPITYIAGDYADLAGEGFDCIISSLVAHHMTHDQLVAFLGFMEREASAGWMINDLHRHGFAYSGWPLLAGIMRWHKIVKHDGRLSIARSYRPHEWPGILAEANADNARVYRAFPFRLCVEAVR